MSQADGVAKFIRGTADACAGAPDTELVHRFATSGDEQAFRALVARYGAVVWAVCRRVVRNHHDAEDAFQATFLVLARRAGGLRTGSAVGGWLYAVAYRTAARVRAKRRAEPADVEPAAGTRGGALDELSAREAEAALHEELARLPEKYRTPLLLCCLDGLSRDEAATRLGWSANRVKNGLAQGRERLRARLARRGIALGLPLLTGLLAAPAGAVPPSLTQAAVLHATGSPAPAAVSSLANKVTQTMWFSKWKWTVAGCAALALTAGGTLAAVLRAGPETPPAVPVAKAEPVLAPVAPEPPGPAPALKKESPKAAWDVAAEYLELVFDDKPERARELSTPDGPTNEEFEKLRAAGLERVRPVLILPAAKVFVVTERIKPKNRANAAGNEHVFVTLEREGPAGPWRVQKSSVLGEKELMGVVGDYFDSVLGHYEDKPDPVQEKPDPKWGVAVEFLELVRANKPKEALKLTLPGTISEKKIGELAVGRIGTKSVAVLINDTRIEIVFPHSTLRADNTGEVRYLFLALTRETDGPWQVKDIDLHPGDGFDQIRTRVGAYLGGRYDAPAKK
jgi:RNA polymerase sigma factor (sigma-70 family)